VTERRERTVTGRHVLLGLLAFFGVVVLVNGTFVILSLSSWTGVETEAAYQRGLDYNRTISAAEEQRARGWRAGLDVSSRANGGTSVALSLVDGAGRPVDVVKVDVLLRRPTNDREDRQLAMEPDGSGRYVINLDPSDAGRWKVRVDVRLADGSSYVVEDELWLR
jgi:nitrogen fixation protein FixH